MLKSLWHDRRDRNEASSPGSETRFEHVNKSLKNWGGKVYNSVHAILLVFQIIPALSSQEQAVSQTSTTHSSSSFSKFAISSTHTFPSWTQFHCSGQTWIWYQTPHYFASSGVLSHPGSTPTPCGDTFTCWSPADIPLLPLQSQQLPLTASDQHLPLFNAVLPLLMRASEAPTPPGTFLRSNP